MTNQITIPLDVYNKLIDESRELAALKDECNYEWGVHHTSYDLQDPHREGYTEEEARKWLDETYEMFKSGEPRKVFKLIRRTRTPWKLVEFEEGN